VYCVYSKGALPSVHNSVNISTDQCTNDLHAMIPYDDNFIRQKVVLMNKNNNNDLNNNFN